MLTVSSSAVYSRRWRSPRLPATSGPDAVNHMLAGQYRQTRGLERHHRGRTRRGVEHGQFAEVITANQNAEHDLLAGSAPDLDIESI
jgi:hypothetical protein